MNLNGRNFYPNLECSVVRIQQELSQSYNLWCTVPPIRAMDYYWIGVLVYSVDYYKS